MSRVDASRRVSKVGSVQARNGVCIFESGVIIETIQLIAIQTQMVAIKGAWNKMVHVIVYQPVRIATVDRVLNRNSSPSGVGTRALLSHWRYGDEWIEHLRRGAGRMSCSRILHKRGCCWGARNIHCISLTPGGC